MSKVLDELNGKYGGKVVGEKIDVYENREAAQKYNVRYVPHLLFVDASGNVFKENIGYMALDEVVKAFKEGGIALD